MDRPLVYLVDDERDLADALAEYLGLGAFRALAASSGADLDRLFLREKADAVVLDLNMPGEDGRAILKRLRGRFPGPIIILTAVDDAIDRVLLLELGADDFITKPAEPRELAARLSGLLRRYRERDSDELRLESVTVDFRAGQLRFDDGRSERLGAGEAALLRAFAARPGRLLTRDELLTLAPAGDADAFDRAIDSRIARLRAKLGTQAIRTQRGAGYIFEPPRRQGA